MTGDDYAAPADVVALRVLTEERADSSAWLLDGVDAAGRYTEECWSYDTEDEALAAAEEFRAELGISPSAPVTREARG